MLATYKYEYEPPFKKTTHHFTEAKTHTEVLAKTGLGDMDRVSTFRRLPALLAGKDVVRINGCEHLSF